MSVCDPSKPVLQGRLAFWADHCMLTAGKPLAQKHQIGSLINGELFDYACSHIKRTVIPAAGRLRESLYRHAQRRAGSAAGVAGSAQDHAGRGPICGLAFGSARAVAVNVSLLFPEH